MCMFWEGCSRLSVTLSDLCVARIRNRSYEALSGAGRRLFIFSIIHYQDA